MFSVFGTILAVGFGCATHDKPPVSPSNARSQSAFLERVKQIPIPAEPIQSQKEVDAWGTAIGQLHDLFWDWQKEMNVEEDISFLVSQFGEGGPELDLKLCLLGNKVFLAQTSVEPAGDIRSRSHNQKISKVVEQYKQRLAHLQLVAARCQTKMFLKNPAKLDRYYCALIWSHEFLVPSSHWFMLNRKAQYLSRSFTGNQVSSYWWFARDAVLLIHATSRDDLLRDADPDKMWPVFAAWYKWFEQSEPYLEADAKLAVWKASSQPRKEDNSNQLKEPAVPFADWNQDIALFPPLLIYGIGSDIPQCFRPH